MSRIGFVQNLAFEYLGVMYLSAALKQAGHMTESFILERNEAELVTQVLDFQPDMVTFSCATEDTPLGRGLRGKDQAA